MSTNQSTHQPATEAAREAADTPNRAKGDTSLKTFICPTCGWSWQQGQSGAHQCVPRLLDRLEAAISEAASLRREVEGLKAELAVEKEAYASADQNYERVVMESAALRSERDALNKGCLDYEAELDKLKKLGDSIPDDAPGIDRLEKMLENAEATVVAERDTALAQLAEATKERDALKGTMRRGVDAIRQIIDLANVNKGTRDILRGIGTKFTAAIDAAGGA